MSDSFSPSLKPVSLTLCNDYNIENVYSSIIKNIENLGNINNFFVKGNSILLKPNLLGGYPPKNAVTTHPSIVEAVVRIAIDCGCKVKIGDSPAVLSTEKASKISGIYDICKKYNIPLADFSRKTEISCGENNLFKKITIASDVMESDTIINLPKFKTHGQMGMTLCVKNTYGYVPGTLKATGHLQSGKSADLFARFIYEIHMIKKPVLNIIDAIWAMEGNGPGSGTPRHLGFIGSSECGFSLDAICAKIASIPVESLPIMTYAPFTFDDICKIPIIGDPIENFIKTDYIPARKSDIRFRLPQFLMPFLHRIVLPSPKIHPTLCKACMMCQKHCPAKALNIINKNKYTLDMNKCIRCFICQEICPHKAITVKESFLFRLKKLFNRS